MSELIRARDTFRLFLGFFSLAQVPPSSAVFIAAPTRPMDSGGTHCRDNQSGRYDQSGAQIAADHKLESVGRRAAVRDDGPRCITPPPSLQPSPPLSNPMKATIRDCLAGFLLDRLTSAHVGKSCVKRMEIVYLASES